ncbi:MAG: AAA-associated domain-containing protein [Candidatus Micrarchaeia archaeon]
MQFPLNVGISEVRGVVEIIKDHGDELSVSKLAEESGEDVDKIIPLLDVAELLGLCNVENGVVKLTDSGKSITLRNYAAIISKILINIEPFKSVVEALKNNSLNTTDLANILKSKNIILLADERNNIKILRSLLLKWGVRTKILSYDRENDSWSLKTAAKI